MAPGLTCFGLVNHGTFKWLLCMGKCKQRIKLIFYLNSIQYKIIELILGSHIDTHTLECNS